MATGKTNRNLTPNQKKMLEEMKKQAEKAGKEKDESKRSFYGAVVLIILVFLVVSILKTPSGGSVGGNLSVHYIDVGQGDCILISSKGTNVLVDCGESSESDKVIKYLSDLNIDKLDYVVGTHPHSDHMGGMSEIVKAFDIGEFIIPHLADDDFPTTVYFNKFLDAVEDKNVKLTEAELGRKLVIGDAVGTIIAPNSENYGNTNNYSVGILLENGKNSFIFTGDAEEKAEKEILSSYGLSHVDVYKAGHHGSDTSSSEEFLEAISPDYAVISCGTGNSYGHPKDITLQKLSVYTDKIYRTDLCGTVIIESDGENLTVRTERKSK